MKPDRALGVLSAKKICHEKLHAIPNVDSVKKTVTTSKLFNKDPWLGPSATRSHPMRSLQYSP